jgi:hypothetical protein
VELGVRTQFVEAVFVLAVLEHLDLPCLPLWLALLLNLQSKVLVLGEWLLLQSVKLQGLHSAH